MRYTAPMPNEDAQPPSPSTPDDATPQSPPATPQSRPDVTPQQIGDYANFVRIAHAPGDFSLDFGQHVPEQGTVAMKRRIIMSPVNVKNLLRALTENVKKYEERYGTIANDPTR